MGEEAPAWSRHTACPACGGDLIDALSRLGSLARAPYRRCVRCGLLQASITADSERTFYAEVYPHLPHKRDEDGRRAGLLAERIAALEGVVTGRRLLDIGCGSGEFIRQCRLRGWHCTGVDVAWPLLQRARRCSDADLVLGELDALRAPRRFDLVTFWNVLDHLPNPRAAARQAASLLAADGALVVRVPNGAVHRVLMTLAALLGATAGAPLVKLTPLHPWVLRPSDLRRLLLDAGLTRVTVCGSPPTEGRFNSPRRLLRAVGNILATAAPSLPPLTPSIEAVARR